MYFYYTLDKVTKKPVTGLIAENEKDALRQLAFCGYFKVNRWTDTELYVINEEISPENSTKEDILKIAKELEVKLENESEKIEGTVGEVKEKIDKKVKKEV